MFYISISESFAMYVVRAHNRWVRPKDDAYHMGVILLAEAETDLEQWVENFPTLVADPA